MTAEGETPVNGAESLVHTLLKSGVDTCFANPGTSEMHFVAALDRIPGMRCVLGLQENIVTGMADGYWRMAEKPAATLLHCGPGRPTARPTCTTPAAPAAASSTSWVTRRPIIARWMPSSPPTPRAGRAPSPAGCGRRWTPSASAPMPPWPCRPRAPHRGRSPR
ncbi:thiamine pyrophosphate-binding protein [Teichococcus aestuarii]